MKAARTVEGRQNGNRDATDAPTRVAEHVARSPWGDRGSRIGLGARGVVYLLFAYLVARVADGALGAGGTSKPASGPGVAQALAAEPAGRPVLAVLALGLLCYALFSLLDAFLHHDDETPAAKRWGDRLLSVWGFIIFAAFGVYSAWTALSPSGGSGTSERDMRQKTQWSATVLRWPAGAVWLGALGAVLLVISAFLVSRAIRRSFLPRLDLHGVSPAVRKVVVLAGAVGYLGRAGLFGTVGGCVIFAAVENDPAHGQGVDGSLRLLASSASGPAWLWLLAVCLAVYGAYMFAEVRYRRV